MARGKRDGLLIVGGGLAGSLAALAMAKLRPEVPILLIEEGASFGGDHDWTFFDSQIDEEHRWLLDPMVGERWPGVYVAFPKLPRKLELGFNSIVAADLDRHVRKQLRPSQYRLNTKVVGVRENEVVLPGGEKIKADATIDARGAAHLSMLDLGWRKSVSREYAFARPHRVDLPVLIDATVEQTEGMHYFALRPLDEQRLIVEDVCLAEMPELDLPAVHERIETYCELRGWRGGKHRRESSQVVPLALSDDVQAFWRGSGAQVAKIGRRGGFFHPSTGESLPDAVRNAMILAAQPDMTGAALHDLFEGEVERLWRKRDFHRTFNAALFDATVWERREVMAGLYRLDEKLIARFHGANLGMLDRMRIGGAKSKAKR